jgi:hypothetical protein
VGVRVLATAAFSLSLLLLTAALGYAQAPAPPPAPQAPPPAPGFVPPYEITAVVRSAGFQPLAPPLREGTTYVLRATDFRGILMRVVVDAHSGAIRAVNRIVPGPGAYGRVGMVEAPYGAPPDSDAADLARRGERVVPPLPIPSATRPAAHPPVAALPPLPRPRPAQLASPKAAPETASAATLATPAVKLEAKSSDAKSNATIAAPAAVSVAPSKAPAPVPLND